MRLAGGQVCVVEELAVVVAHGGHVQQRRGVPVSRQAMQGALRVVEYHVHVLTRQVTQVTESAQSAIGKCAGMSAV